MEEKLHQNFSNRDIDSFEIREKCTLISTEIYSHKTIPSSDWSSPETVSLSYYGARLDLECHTPAIILRGICW